MPIYCDNKIIVELKSKVELEKFLGDVKLSEEQFFSFQKISPVDESIEAEEDIEDWKWKMWGTNMDSFLFNEKFNIEKSKFFDEIYTVSLFFSTNLSTPSEIAKKISSLYANCQVTLKYFNQVLKFFGEEVYLSGMQIFDKHFEEDSVNSEEGRKYLYSESFDWEPLAFENIPFENLTIQNA